MSRFSNSTVARVNDDGLRLRIRLCYHLDYNPDYRLTYHSGSTQLTNSEVEDLVIGEWGGPYLSYLVAPEKATAVLWETALLNRFMHEHGQLPP